MTRTQQKVSTTVPTDRQIMATVQRGIMMTWHSTINIQMTNTHSMLELWSGRSKQKSISNSSLIVARDTPYAPEHVLTHLTVLLLLILVNELQCPSIEMLATYFLI